jgi:hypothetical protein
MWAFNEVKKNHTKRCGNKQHILWKFQRVLTHMKIYNSLESADILLYNSVWVKVYKEMAIHILDSEIRNATLCVKSHDDVRSN